MRIPLSEYRPKLQDRNLGSHLAIEYYTKNEEMKITGFIDRVQYEN